MNQRKLRLLIAVVTLIAAVIALGTEAVKFLREIPTPTPPVNLTSMAQHTQETAEAIPGTLVFSVDFENGLPDNFTVDFGNWSIVDDGTGNKVLESDTKTDAVSTIEFSTSDDLNNFVVEYRVKLTNYSIQQKGSGGHSLQFRKTPETFYALLFDQTTPGISFDYVSDSGWNWIYVIGKPFSLKRVTWYDVKVEAKGDEFKAYVNDVLYLTLSDSRLTHGNFAFSVGTNTVYQFDDIRVLSLP